MSRSHELATVGYVRRVAVTGMVLFGFIVGGVGFKAQVDGVQNLRAACDRGNTRNQTAWLNTFRDAEARKLAAPDLDSKIGDLAADGFADARSLLETAAPVSISPGGDGKPGLTEADAIGVSLDCDRAYPLPWPL